MGILGKYRLKKDLPNLPAGVIFEHRQYDKAHPDWGNHGCGAMILAWINGNCQAGWCGETYIMPGQLAENKEWFERIDISLKDQLLAEIESLKKRVEKL